MKYGFSIPHRGPMANRRDIAALVRHGEALGFTYATVPDHILVPLDIASRYPYSDSGEFPGSLSGESMEQIALMSYVGAITGRIRILSSIMVIPHRHPLQVAKALATIDQLTEGRVTLGCGTGWMEEEFLAIGAEPFAERGRVTDEYIRVMKEVWTADEPSYAGDYVNFPRVHFRPQPAQKPCPPVWIGGESAPALRRAVSLGDAWYPIASNPKFPLDTLTRYRARVKRLHELAEEAGRDPATIELNYSSASYGGGRDDGRTEAGEHRLFTGGAANIAADIEAMAEIGVRHLFFSYSARTSTEARTVTSAEEYSDRLTYWMEEVASKVSG